MAYEEMTYERIMSRCLARVPGTVDKREGSIIYDAIAPAAAELAILYSTLSTEMDRAFPDTAADVDLTNKAKERGVFRLPASAAVRKGVFKGTSGYMDIPIGSRFSVGTDGLGIIKPSFAALIPPSAVPRPDLIDGKSVVSLDGEVFDTLVDYFACGGILSILDLEITIADLALSSVNLHIVFLSGLRFFLKRRTGRRHRQRHLRLDPQ